MTYAGCPECFAKMQETQAQTLTGMVECLKCKKIVQRTYNYFFRCQLQDATGSIEIGFARNFGTELLASVEPDEFRRLFYNKPEQFDVFCNDKIFHRPVKVIVKKRTELFQGQTVERYYAFGADYNITDDRPVITKALEQWA